MSSSDATPRTDGTSTPDLDALVDDWMDWAETARRLGTSVSRVRVLIKDHHLAAAVPRPGAGQQVPSAFVQEGEILKGLSGLVMMLTDHGFDHREIIEWLYTDADLPGRPVDALVENRGSEVKRRAQAMH